MGDPGKPVSTRRQRLQFKLRHLGSVLRDSLTAVGPSLLLLAAGLYLAYLYVDPAPPRQVRLSVGSDDSAYAYYAKRYHDVLAADHIDLVIEDSSGAAEDLRRLRDPSADVDIGFLQDGLNQGADDDLMSLGSIGYEPLWVFYRDRYTLGRLSDLKGKRIGVGSEGSGTALLAGKLLTASGIDAQNSQLLPVGRDDAARMLSDGQLDAAIILGAPASRFIRGLVAAPDIRVMSMDQAEALCRRFPFLHHIVLPAGVLDLANDVPRQQIDLVATTSTLVARKSLHPALVSLMMKAMFQTHARAGVLNDQGEFPADRDVDFPLSPDAEHYYKSGPPFLQRYLPFWLATLIDRMMVVLVPLIAAALPLIRLVPMVYAWRIKNRIYRWYGELKFLETRLQSETDPGTYADYLKQVQWIDQQAARVQVPVSYSEYFYALKDHIELVRRHIERMIDASSADGSSGEAPDEPVAGAGLPR